MRIAVVHDYFTQMGGAEKVAEELVRMFARRIPAYHLCRARSAAASLAGMPIETSWMQHLPRMKDFYRLYFLLYHSRSVRSTFRSTTS